jgi:hypothetical protein
MEVRDKDRNAICALAIDFRGLASETEKAAGGCGTNELDQKVIFLASPLFPLNILLFFLQ